MYLACSSESSVRWASKFGRCRLATYSSAGKHTRHTSPGARHQVAVLSNSRTAATCTKQYSLTLGLMQIHFSCCLPIFLGSRYTSCLYRPSGALNNSIRARACRQPRLVWKEQPQQEKHCGKRARENTNLSCSSDGQHKCRNRGAAQVKEASLRDEKRCDGAAVKHNKEEEQDSRQLPGGRHAGDSDDCRLIRSEKLLQVMVTHHLSGFFIPGYKIKARWGATHSSDLQLNSKSNVH